MNQPSFTVEQEARAGKNGTLLSGAPASTRVFTRVWEYATTRSVELTDITERVSEIVAASGIDRGLLHVQSLHTTTALFLNESQEALLHDMGTWLQEIVLDERYWRHNDPKWSDCERKNAAAHLRGLLLGQVLSLQVRNGKVLLGTWQSIILAEFDGPRTRSLALQVMGI